MDPEANELFWSNSFYGGYTHPSVVPTQSGVVPDTQFINLQQPYTIPSKPMWSESPSKPHWNEPTNSKIWTDQNNTPRPHPPPQFPSSVPQPSHHFQNTTPLNNSLNHNQNTEEDDIFSLLSNNSAKDFPIDLGFPSKNLNGKSHESDDTYKDQDKRDESKAGKSNETDSVDYLNEKTKKRSIRKATIAKRALEQSTQNPSSFKEDDFDPSVDFDSGGENNVKRQRRLVKNREAAQQFRQRQKTYIQDLESTVTKLNTEKLQYQSKVDLLTTENRLIKEQLNYLRDFISQVISSLPTQMNKLPPHI